MENNINQMRQNHPELVIRDLSSLGIDAALIRQVLKNRGINKWLRVRRLLIQLKDVWKKEITETQNQLKEVKCQKNGKQYYLLKGKLQVLASCRQQIRALCHSTRDVDFPLSGFGDICKLPKEFPKMPHKKYFW